ncbi:MAG: hypothetical protein GC159_03880 [Phycisphaera sp.]|nr:hypothetical protein [Phycisphaera sp.]
MRIDLFADTSNRDFESALVRVRDRVEILNQHLHAIELEGPSGDVCLTFFDEDESFYYARQIGNDKGRYEVEVGYDYSDIYPDDEDDVLVIQLIEEKLQQIISNGKCFASEREQLLKVVEDWTTWAIGG